MTFALQHYLYYDSKTGDPYKVCFRDPPEDACAIKISNDQANEFMTGKAWINHYQVLFIKGKLEIVKKDNLNYNHTFKNKTHYYINDDVEDPDCQVIWNQKEKHWNFTFSEKIKDMLESKLVISKLMFFVTLQTDFNFLIRIIELNSNNILEKSSFSIPFLSTFENDIEKISISTYAVLNTYGLKTIHEQD